MCLAIPGRLVDLPPERPQFALVEVAGVRRQSKLSRCNRIQALPGK